MSSYPYTNGAGAKNSYNCGESNNAGGNSCGNNNNNSENNENI